GANKHGRSGADTVLRVPLGTVVFERDGGGLLGDLTMPGQRLLVARGARGGRGNARFASATNRAPRRADLGRAGEERWIHLELEAYSKELSRRPQIVAANKAELPGTEERRRALEQFCAAAGLPFHAVSAVTGLGLSALVHDAGDRLLSGLSATASRDVIECRAS